LASLSILVLLSLFCKKGPGEENYLKPINVSNNPARSIEPSIAVDSKGTVHLVWTDYTPGKRQIFYAFKPKGGVWTVPVNVSNTYRSASHPSLVVDKEDNLHLAWQQWVNGLGWVIFYSYQLPSGGWSTPETIIATGGDVGPKIVVDSVGRVFMVWYGGGYSGRIYFSLRETNGMWTSPVPLCERGYVDFEPEIAVDKKGKVHVAWNFWDGGYSSNVFYTMRDTMGNWSEPSIIFAIDSFADYPVLTSDKDGNVHIAWWDSTLIYMYKSPEGNWSAPEFPGVGLSPYAIAIDNNGTVYIAYLGPRLIKKTKDGSWEKPILVVRRLGGIPSLAIDNEGIKHLAWDCTPPDTIDTQDIYYVEVKDY